MSVSRDDVLAQNLESRVGHVADVTGRHVAEETVLVHAQGFR